VRLQDQPFRILVVLLEHAGQVVTREEIQGRIWPDNTFVDFDSSLRVALRKLRDALGDDAERPVYVETIPKRGYRFLVPVSGPVPSHAVDVGPAPVPVVRARSGRRAVAVTAAVIVGVTIGAVAYSEWAHRRGTAIGVTHTVVLAEFANTTGDPVFDGTMRQGLIVQLEQSPFLSLVSDERIQQTLRMMAQPVDARMTLEAALAICERTSGAAVIDGSIARLGNQYVIGLRAKSCGTGATIDEEQAQTARKEDVLSVLSRMSRPLRRRLGESLTSVQAYATPIAEATTASLDAFRAYSAGKRALSSTGSASAIPLFEQAVQLDPSFAIAHALLGRVYGDIGEFERSAESTAKAYELRSRASQTEQYFISASYDLQVSGNLEKARQTSDSWTQAYPRAFAPHSFLAGIILPALGSFDRTVDESRRTIDADPGFWVGYYLLAFGQQYQNHFDAAEQALDEAARHQLDVPEFAVERYDLAFLKDDAAAMDRVVASASEKPEVGSMLGYHRAFALAYLGRLRQAAALVERSTAMARQSGERDVPAQLMAAEALWDGFFGDAAGATQSASAAIAASRDRDVEFGAAIALALAGDNGRGDALAEDLTRRFPEDTDVRFHDVPAIRALVDVNMGRPSHALDTLQLSVPYELAMPRSGMHAFFGALYPVYVRGLAFLALHRGADAAGELRKILDHRGVVVSDPVGALARYQLGRAYAMSGDVQNARAAFEEVRALWKDADADVPIIREARAH
jgi:tetratricopeptide (TPR) repeat protein